MNVLIAAVLAFISTNIDDLFVLMLLFSQAQSTTVRLKIAAGQLLGIGVLLSVSIAGALGTGLLPQIWLRLLGLVPLGMGMHRWFSRELESGEAASVRMGLWHIALLTVANGGDNLGVYIPLFAGYSLPELALTGAVFAAMTALWCALGKWLAELPAVAHRIRKYQHILVPAVLVALGVSVLLGM